MESFAACSVELASAAARSWDQRSRRDRVLVCIAAAGSLLAAGSVYRRWRWSSKRRRGKATGPKLPADADLLRVGFSAKKLPDIIDHVIIGSGLSGLYLASLLSRLGRRVVVLEQHYVAGGCTHTFKDQGYEFDTGVHYVGSATQLTAFMDFAAGRRGAFTMRRQGLEDGSEVYNEIFVGGKCIHRFRPGPKTFVQDLVDKFPAEEAAIRKFFREVDMGGLTMVLPMAKCLMPAWLWKALLVVPGPVKFMASRYIKRSFSEVVSECGIKDSMLRAILCAEFGDHGMVPEKAPFFLQAGILAHYMPEGGFSFSGGSENFAKVLVDTIFGAGGAVFVRAPVTKIVVEHGRAVGVEMAGGKGTIRARRSVVSSAGAEATYRKLLDEAAVEQLCGVPQSLVDSERSRGVSHHVYGFIGFEGNNEELALPTYNLWSFPPAPGVSDPSDLTAIWNSLLGPSPTTELPEFLRSDEAADRAQVPAFLSFPSAKDDTYNARCPGKSTAVLLTESHADLFKGPGPHGKRGEEYAAIKKRYEIALKNVVFRHFPHLKGKVTYCDVGTPFSNDFYLNRFASYGLDQTSERFLDPTLRADVRGISGLYLTGQDIFCCGVFPQVITAWLTMAKVMGATSVDFWILLGDFAMSVGRRCLFDKTYLPARP